MNNFKEYAYYYNAFYGDKDYAGEARIVDYLLKNEGGIITPPQKIKVLNIGCGTGKHDYELHKFGYRIKGIDLSDNMISIAKDNYEKDDGSISFSTGDFRTYEDDVKYDAVISLFHVVSYQNLNEDVISSFMTANKVLEKGGIFIFDLWYGPGVVNQLPENRIRKVEDDNNTIIRFASPYIHWNENVVDVNYEVFVVNKCSNTVSKINETHKMRYFFKPEIENMLNLAGFKLLSCLDCNTLHETDEKSWTAYFTAKKISEV